LIKFNQLIVHEIMPSTFTNLNFYQQPLIAQTQTNPPTRIIQFFILSPPNPYYQLILHSPNTLQHPQSVFHALQLIPPRIEYPSYIID
uniref:hypothetical protein n=1 Tax=Bacillus pseudomycoides TaxID=64104 RepID=UPI0021B4DD38